MHVSVKIRSEQPSDIAAIEAVTLAAFQTAPHSGQTEHFIVRALRDAGVLTLSLVAVDGGAVIGHVAVSPVTVSDGTADWYGLGPISVLPSHQRAGIGSRLMERALAELKSLAAGGCVVLGDPGYYARFGFAADPALNYPDVPQAYFQVLCFKGPLPMGTVAYHAAFSAQA